MQGSNGLDYPARMPKPDPLELLANNIRDAAKKHGGLKKLQKRTNLSTGTFYALIGDKPRVPTLPTLRKLSKAEVQIPEELLAVG